MAKQLKKFCRITKYIEKTDPKFHEILDDLCILGAIRPRRGHNGVTFIWPSKETIAKLDKIRYTDEIEKGCEIVLAHIVHDYIPNAAAWNAKKSDIPNGLNQKLEIKEVKGSRVILADGAELEHDAKFKTFSRGDENQSVWFVAKGSLDHTKHTKKASFEHARQGAQPVKRGGATTYGGGDSQNHIIGDYCKALAKSVAAHNAGQKAVVQSNLYGFLVDFYMYLQAKNDTDALAYLDIVLSPLPLTSAAFVLREDSDEEKNFLRSQLADFRHEVLTGNTYGKGLYGITKYIEIVRKACSKTTGGAVETIGEANAILSRAITKALGDSREALDKHGAQKLISPKLFTNLNMARLLEFDTLRDITDQKNLTDESSIEQELTGLAELVKDRANTQPAETDSNTQKLGAFVAGLLAAVENFSSSDFAVYPFDKNAKATAEKSIKLVERYNQDTSAHSVFSKLNAEAMSDFLSDVNKQSSTEAE